LGHIRQWFRVMVCWVTSVSGSESWCVGSHPSVVESHGVLGHILSGSEQTGGLDNGESS